MVRLFIHYTKYMKVNLNIVYPIDLTGYRKK